MSPRFPMSPTNTFVLSPTNTFVLPALRALLLLSINVLAQQASATPPASSATSPASTVKTVQVTASKKEAEVGQQVKLSVVAKDASGKVVTEQPSTYFAGPFDIAAADESGNAPCRHAD